MAFVVKEVDAFYIIGISVRTANLNKLAQFEISELWDYFIRENLSEKISNKTSEDTYCVYTDYESDATGLYTAIIGKPVSSLDEIPEGMIGITIPKAQYQVYTSKGKLETCVANTWKKIWEAEINRSYTFDFDVYGEKAQNPEFVEVLTYVGIN